MTDIQLDSQAINDIIKAARDNGFDCEVTSDSPRWLRFRSTSELMASEPIIDLSKNNDGFLIAIYNEELFHILVDNHQLAKPAFLSEKPSEAEGVVCVGEFDRLYEVLNTIFKFVPSASSLSAPLQQYQKKTIKLPETTEEERMVKQRIGQNILRDALLKQEEGICVVTGLAMPKLLIASHIKPWRDATDEERLSLDNVFLLAPHIDSLFDNGYITFDDNGHIIFSPLLSEESRQKLGLNENMHILRSLTAANRSFLQYHREKVLLKK